VAIQEVRVSIKPTLPDPLGNELWNEIVNSLRMTSIKQVRTARVFRFEGITEDQAVYLAENLLCEGIFELYRVNAPIITDTPWLLEIAYRPGVMNPEASSLRKAAEDLGIKGLVAADSSREYAFYGDGITPRDIDLITDRLLVNPTVQQVVREKPRTLLVEGKAALTQVIPVRSMSDDELLAVSRDRLFLSLEEMRHIQAYFRELGRDPTDCELETLAQTWSEHCFHKTFKARLIVNGTERPPLLERLREATRRLRHPLVLSAFVDNSGVMAFYEGWAVCGKVETHNSPSAIEPYGGAATGSGGVFRDIMGTGQGAKVIASTDMFCFAPPDTPEENIPPGCLHPRYLLRRVVAGVRDYGNRMGIPTNNGSVHFHPDFRAKPTVIVGAYGLIPAARCQKGTPVAGDLILVIGGRTGRDGIHGATFSSAAMTDRTHVVNAQAVQIGHPIEEKRVADAILAARDEGLIRAITDCGAGGFASAVGEMAAHTGARIALDRAPLKYTGLAPWEILLSESQERMVVAIAPANLNRFLEICRRHNVEATVLGEFTDDGRFTATFHNEKVLDLPMEFLHRGIPQRQLQAAWHEPPRIDQDCDLPDNWPETCKRVMRHLNVCSKEPIVRVYDHGVQGANVLAPYAGVKGNGPNDAVVLTPLLGKPYGLIIGHGLNPVLNLVDSYWGGLWAATEAVANVVAVGGNPDETALIDNFIWPVPEPDTLAQLSRAVDACVDFSLALGMPFISGKDSLSSTYRGADGTVIRIPPVLCVSAFGRIPDVRRTVSADFKKTSSAIYLVGARRENELGGSVYYEIRGVPNTRIPRVNLELLPAVFRAIYRAIGAGSVLACHDISEGGLVAALAEMCFGGQMGAVIDIPAASRPDAFLFNETPGCFLVEVEDEAAFRHVLGDAPAVRIGRTQGEQVIRVRWRDEVLFAIDLAVLETAWEEPMKEVFGC